MDQRITAWMLSDNSKVGFVGKPARTAAGAQLETACSNWPAALGPNTSKQTIICFPKRSLIKWNLLLRVQTLMWFSALQSGNIGRNWTPDVKSLRYPNRMTFGCC